MLRKCAVVAVALACVLPRSTMRGEGVQSTVSAEGVTGLPRDVTSLMSMAGIWQPVADEHVTAANHGTAVDFFGNLRLHNGREGIVAAAWSFKGDHYSTDARLIPTQTALLEQQPDGTLQLATSRYLRDPSTNGAGSVVIADFNGDSVDDVYLASWNEAPNIPASSTAFLSNRTAYDRVSVKDFTYAHGANLAVVDGRPTVFTAAYYRAPGYGNAAAYFDGVNDFTVINDTGLVGASSLAVADFYGNGTHAAVFGDLSFAPGIPFDRANPGIYLYKLRGLLPEGSPIKVATPYFDARPEYLPFPSFTDPTKTHVYRIWTDDFNHDQQVDIVAQGMIWNRSDQKTYKDVIQLLQNDGEYRFRDITDVGNPDYNKDCHPHEYQPQLRDIDGSGIKTYFFGSPSFDMSKVPCNYVLVNDGSGRFHVALHETLNAYSEQVWRWLPSRVPPGNSVAQWPLLRAYQTPNGRVNFLAVARLATYSSSAGYVNRFAFVNVPVQLDLATQFTRPMTVTNQNGSRRIRTLGGDDMIYASGQGAATIDGGGGVNTVIYPHPQDRYAVTGDANGSWRVVKVGSAAGDTLLRIQHVRFGNAPSGRSAVRAAPP